MSKKGQNRFTVSMSTEIDKVQPELTLQSLSHGALYKLKMKIFTAADESPAEYTEWL